MSHVIIHEPNVHFPRLTPRLSLVMPEPGEARRVVQYVERNREHHAPWDPPRPANYGSVDFWKRKLERNRSDFRYDRTLCLFLEKDGALIGACNFTNILRGPLQACILGYHLDHEHQGQGFMREALESSIDFVFNELGLHRIAANYIPTNERSGGLLRRLGFAVEGYARDYLFINGAWRDHILTSLTHPNPQPPTAARVKR